MQLKYFVVFGGELFNKGAQSMTFIVVNEIANRFPDCMVVLVSTNDSKRSEKEKSIYRFMIVRSPRFKDKMKMIFRKIPIKKSDYCASFIDIMSNSIGVIDISGYALGSNWGTERSLAYLTRIVLAKSFKKPIWLLPQSFGPLDYKGVKGWIFNISAKIYLPYAKLIMARENEGKNLLEKKYGLKNVVKASDLVLQNTGIDINNIYVSAPLQQVPIIRPKSVALIPNTKNNAYGNKSDVMLFYSTIIDDLLSAERNVYLIYHSSQDLDLCKEIKKKYISNNNVILIEEELSCINYDAVINSFDFIIASRYHSIVHAYRRGIPAIVLGWATKYHELADLLGQANYVFDVRNSIDLETIKNAIAKMIVNFPNESAIISDKMQVIRQENVFDYIQEYIEE